jgi:hypothetical protein
MDTEIGAIIYKEALAFVADESGKLVRLETLITPGYFSRCRLCPLVECPMRVNNPTPEYDDHCRIEEAALIDASNEFIVEGGSLKNRLMLVSLFDNIVLKLRMSRVGAQIDYRRIVDNPKMMTILDRYVSMMMSIDRRYVADIKEMQLTPKEKDAKKKEQVNTAMLIANMMKKARELPDSDDHVEETEGEKAFKLKPVYEVKDELTTVDR